ncbi:20632_t:CDS:2 [Gigaspora margarita]|uniref:20632_t:CDS:1 n=1 Tax=Gigaspora margarita TaxID=4874 RepID=A0ABN7VJM0_GIGMA|nr:20632_t:CDS:2 [Gigaspora margarita]
MDEIVSEIEKEKKKFTYEDFQDIKDLSNISDELSNIKHAYLKPIKSATLLKEYNKDEYDKFIREVENLRTIEVNENVIKFIGIIEAISLPPKKQIAMKPTIKVTDKNVTYVDPESFDNTTVNLSSDIYSLGVIFWEISSGRPPFSNNHELDKLKSSLISGERESPINLTPVDYKELYCDAWNESYNKRPRITDVISRLEDIDLNFVYHINQNPDYIPKISYKKNNSTSIEGACLKVIKGSFQDQYLFLYEDEILIGRKDSNYIVIKDQEINKKHAKIQNYQGKYFSISS